MNVLTLRLKPEHSETIRYIQHVTGIKHASKALMASAEAYMTQRNEIERLQGELSRMTAERNRYKKVITDYQQAHMSLLQAD